MQRCRKLLTDQSERNSVLGWIFREGRMRKVLLGSDWERMAPLILALMWNVYSSETLQWAARLLNDS